MRISDIATNLWNEYSDIFPKGEAQFKRAINNRLYSPDFGISGDGMPIEKVHTKGQRSVTFRLRAKEKA